MACVYTITHRESGAQYIGMTSVQVRKRWQHHIAGARAGRHGCAKVSRALAKYGEAAFDFAVIADLPTFEEAQIAEMIAIATRLPSLNITRGGDGRRCPHDTGTRAKIAASAKARGQKPPSGVGTEAARRVHLGAKRSPEWREAMSAAQRKRFGPERTPEEKRALMKKRQAEYYLRNAEEIKARVRAYKAATYVPRPRQVMTPEEYREARRESSARWRASNPEKLKAQTERRKLRRRAKKEAGRCQQA